MGRTKKLTQEASRLDKKEWKSLLKLDTPQKIQDFLDKQPFSFENSEDPVSTVLKRGSSHCLEGALLAAAALWAHGGPPLILDLRAEKRDWDHVAALFQKNGKWGAISKTNHAVLRYREPIYRDVRELAMSFFHEYFLKDGKKTLRSFSKPFDLSKEGTKWLTSKGAVVDIAYKLDRSPHVKILTPAEIKNLRKAHKVEIEAGEVVEWKK
jgi:hypothetical protein